MGLYVNEYEPWQYQIEKPVSRIVLSKEEWELIMGRKKARNKSNRGKQ